MSNSNTKWTKENVRDRLLGVLDKIIDDSEITTNSKLKAIELLGKEFGLFVEQKKVQIDVNTIVRHLSDGQISALLTEGVPSVKQLPDRKTLPVDRVDSLDIDYRVVTPDVGVLDGEADIDDGADAGS